MNTPSAGDAWMKYCMMTSVMREMYAFGSHLNCFRAGQLESSTINLCNSGACAENIAGGKCQEWHQNDPLPNCLFASLVRRLGLMN